MASKLRQTALGYYEIWPKPARDELRRYYSGYYANPDRANQYSYGYTAEELEHKTIAVSEAHHYAPTGGSTFFEIGCGEGFFLKGFSDRGWIVEGVDFTDDGLQKYHPELRKCMVVGDVFDVIDEKVERGRKYDFIACNNVLEHVIDPIALLEQLTALLKPRGGLQDLGSQRRLLAPARDRPPRTGRPRVLAVPTGSSQLLLGRGAATPAGGEGVFRRRPLDGVSR